LQGLGYAAVASQAHETSFGNKALYRSCFQAQVCPPLQLSHWVEKVIGLDNFFNVYHLLRHRLVHPSAGTMAQFESKKLRL